nr:DUF4304 domain-containing protein [uncultured Psychroserpens sp.]
MKLYDLIHESGKRIIYFPLSQFSRVSVDKTKHSFGNKEFKKLVNQVLKPLLEKNGFKGNDYFYYRLRNNNIETILIGTSPYGKAVCINVEIKKHTKNIDVLNQEKIDKLESISPTKQGWKRLSPDKEDCWWQFRATETKNRKVLKEIFNLIELEGEKYFTKYNK